ncbi:hypothetical protein PHLGIDRAFT_129039 [Phlebiopsis gigantea 11061_1 CR5-6]|uniref:Peptidase M16 N-terminal domain-containing protein n=1 Tax=Phlebiopsis gigantea (strain 11061_1 CR5-6) TaxID=745531 RepID=A0A0C3S4S9_PHLG1|nr:hypothetical protein PHLGIDRAFT_129039 [Phlebiopsis gigantea 11061_1 CR5-6]
MAYPSWADGPSWTTVAATADCPEHAVYTGNVDKSDLDEREYRLVRLNNGILGVLVHDESTDKAAASLHVATGHLQDPDDVPGLAHFCEHMIMKAGSSSGITRDLSPILPRMIGHLNGGVKNGVTGPALQDYFFSVNSPALASGIPRLAAFFWGPLFTPGLTAREMNAVDSENKRNLQNDVRRITQVAKGLSVNGHPWRKFGTGNVATLTEKAKKAIDQTSRQDEDQEGDGGAVGREVRKMLIEWWEKQYCAGRMTLAVVGKEPLDDLTKLVIPAFSKIPNRGLDPRPMVKDPFWGPEQFATIVYIKTVKDYHAFRLSFPIAYQGPLYQTRPAQFVAHFVGHEGPGSICAFLKQKGWLVSLTAGHTQDNRSVPFFDIAGTLTKEGYRKSPSTPLVRDSNANTPFYYLSLLRSSAFEAYHFAEIAQTAKTHFRFREKSQPHTYARELARRLLDPVPPERILDFGALVREWDETGVRELLEALVPERGRVLLMAKDHDAGVLGNGVGVEQVWEKERWYGTEYVVKKLDDEFIQEARQPHANPALALPGPNPYIPSDFSVERIPVDVPARVPEKVQESTRASLWFKKDDQFWVPKARVQLRIRTPYARLTPRHAVLTSLYTNLVEDTLAEIAYDATIAGLDYGVSSTAEGIHVSVSGYNDKIPVLLRTVLEKLRSVEIRDDRLRVFAEQLGLSYKNYYLGQPSNLSQYFVACVFNPFVWTPAEKLQEISTITSDDVEKHKRELLSKVHFEALITGNIRRDRAAKIMEDIEEQFSDAQTLAPAEWHRHRCLLLPPGADVILEKTHVNTKEMNSALTYYCHFGDLTDDRLRATLVFLVHVIKEPTFSQLRTVEQLGYVVSATVRSSTGSMGLDIKIQSLKPPSFLEGRVDAFLEAFRDVLAGFSEEKLAHEKNSLIMKLLEKPKNLGEESARFWDKINWEYYDFLQNEIDANTIETLALEEVVQAYDAFVAPKGSSRRKLSVHLVAQQTANEPSTASTLVREEGEAIFKASLACSAAAVPVSRPGEGPYPSPKL